MSEPSLKPDLFEQGTRWEHYIELRDIFAIGVEVLKNLRVKSSNDQEKQKKLQHAVEMIEGRLNYITDFSSCTAYGSALRRVIDNDVDDLYFQMRQERANEQPKNATDDDSESPANYSTK